MKPKIFFVQDTKDPNGKITLSKAELEDIVEQAYNAGWSDGYAAKCLEIMINPGVTPSTALDSRIPEVTWKEFSTPTPIVNPTQSICATAT